MFAYCGNNPICNSDPSGFLWVEIIAVAIVIACCLVSCSSDVNTNCYAYALRKDTDPETGESQKLAVDPGDFSTKNYANDILMYSPGRAALELSELVEKDAKALGYYCEIVYSIENYTPKEGNWLIALAYCPEPSGLDYHFWRQEADGSWTHKLPTEDPRSTDFSGKTIYNPKNSDRGKYTQFVWYFEIGPNKGG